MQIINKYAKPCRTCRQHIEVGCGFACKESGYWNTYCKAHAPEQINAPADSRRELTADGKVIMPYEPANVPLVKAMPGARFNPTDKSWQISLANEDRPRLLEIADQIGLKVAPELREVKVSEATIQAVNAASTKGLFPFQVTGVEFLSRMPIALLGDEMGCVSGESIIHISRNGKSYKTTLADLHFKFNGGTDEWGKSWDLSKPTMVKSLCDGILRLHSIRKVLDKGIKPCLRITTESGKHIDLTPDHEICTGNDEWMEAKDLQVGNIVMANGKPKCKFCESTSNVITYQYAKFPGYCKTCMYRLMRKKPTWIGGRCLDRDGYVRVSGQWEHPNRNRHGQVLEHHLVMEAKLGRFIKKGEIVHHKNGDKGDNRISNLELLESASAHATHHGKAGGYINLNGARGGKGGLVQFIPKAEKIVKIENVGTKHVFDIVCDDPHRNFVANGIIVHNCGKTIQSLAAIDATCGTIVIAPASVKYNWRAEAKKWRPELKAEVLSGRGSFRFPESGEIVIVNFDILPPEWAGKEPKAIDRDCSKIILIVDEAHNVQNYKAQRSQKVKHLSKSCGKVWFLTGTPLLNHPNQLYGVLESGNMARKTFGSWTAFCKLFNAEKDRWGGMSWGQPHPTVPEMLRRVMLRRTRDEVLPDLPKKTYSTIEVNGLSASLKKRLDELYEEWADVLDIDEMPPFEEFSAIRAMIAEAKVEAMLEIVADHEEQEVPLVVFSAHRAPIDELAKRAGWAVITGDVAPEKRQSIVEAFQAGQLKGIGLTIAAGGIGLTLTRAWKALFVDLDWTPALNAQAEDRICRIGQTKPCEIVRMVATHPLEQHVHGLIAKKISMIQSAVENRVEGKIPESVRVEGETDEAYAIRMAAVKIEQDRIHAERKAREEEETKQTAKAKANNILSRKRSKGLLPDETITPERAESIRNALRFMDGECDGAETRDGVGFNKADTYLGKTLAQTGLETDGELLTAWYILKSYPRQLASNFPALFNK